MRNELLLYGWVERMNVDEQWTPRPRVHFDLIHIFIFIFSKWWGQPNPLVSPIKNTNVTSSGHETIEFIFSPHCIVFVPSVYWCNTALMISPAASNNPFTAIILALPGSLGLDSGSSPYISREKSLVMKANNWMSSRGSSNVNSAERFCLNCW